VKSLAVVGGVAANQAVREALTNLCALRDPPISLVAPPPRLCTDNGEVFLIDDCPWCDCCSSVLFFFVIVSFRCLLI
jgi:hypothetical protein